MGNFTMHGSAEDFVRGKSSLDTPTLHRRLKTGYFLLEGMNALGAGYYFNYLFFYMHQHFGWGDRPNLLITALYGLVYMLAAWLAGRFGKKYGYFLSLRIGFGGMTFFMALGGLAPLFLGYSTVMMWLEVFIVIGWTISVCFTWPALQALLSHAQAATEVPNTAGIYNMVWAGTTAFAYFTSGALFDGVGREILFWIPAGLHFVQLLLLAPLEKMNAALPPQQPHTSATLPELNPRPIARARLFVRLAWISNPFAYMAIYGLIPIIPNIAGHLNLTPTYAGLIGSIWFWVRVAAFVGLWLWTGWHYRFRWLCTAFVALILSFVGIALSPNLLMFVGAQVVFGLVVGLIYYSSLYYSMDAGESRGKRGGFHEAAIGLGIFVGPLTGASATGAFPSHANASVWAISGLLVLGFMIFLFTSYRGRN